MRTGHLIHIVSTSSNVFGDINTLKLIQENKKAVVGLMGILDIRIYYAEFDTRNWHPIVFDKKKKNVGIGSV